MKKQIIILFTISVILTSCNDEAYVPLVELGAPVKEFIAPASDYALEVPVYANGPYTAGFVDDVSWAYLDPERGNADGNLYVVCSGNERFRRSAKLVLRSEVDSRTDTVYIKQMGMIEEKLQMDNTEVVVKAAGGPHTEPVNTNLPPEKLHISVTYPSGVAEWIDTYAVSAGYLVLTTKPNTGRKSRPAQMTVSYVDAWGDTLSIDLTLEQQAKN